MWACPSLRTHQRGELEGGTFFPEGTTKDGDVMLGVRRGRDVVLEERQTDREIECD